MSVTTYCACIITHSSSSYTPFLCLSLQIATRLRHLHDREAEITCLFEQLKSVSLALEEAKLLLQEKQNVMDVREYLWKCKVSRM